MWIVIFVVAIILIFLVVVLAANKSEEECQEQEYHLNDRARPRFDAEKGICRATGEPCPIKNPTFGCADCLMANVTRTDLLPEEKKVPDACEYCGADLPKDSENGVVTCMYCGRTYRI